MGRLKLTSSLSLHVRVGLILAVLTTLLLAGLGGLWLQSARNSIHEEVEAATRVSRQWLQALVGEMQALSPEERASHLLAVARGIGRVRANVLEIHPAGDAQALYVSPPSPYKVGRSAPAWFADLLSPSFIATEIRVDALVVTLRPDASRAVLDAWDEVNALAGWAGLLLVAVLLGVRLALYRALQPLDQIMQALDRTGQGRFDTRLPAFAAPELGRLARAFNGMADRLRSAVNENVRLETERELAEQLQHRLAEERRDIARELHDELAQSVTAVRVLAGVVVQRSAEDHSLTAAAQEIVAATGGMQSGVRAILQRLRTPVGGLAGQLRDHLAAWRLRHAQIALQCAIDLDDETLPPGLTHAALRIVQEGLTNVVRHADATLVRLSVQQLAGELHISLIDNGRGAAASGLPAGYGLAGMRERVALLGGQLDFHPPEQGGFAVHARLPIVPNMEEAA